MCRNWISESWTVLKMYFVHVRDIIYYGVRQNVWFFHAFTMHTWWKPAQVQKSYDLCARVWEHNKITLISMFFLLAQTRLTTESSYPPGWGGAFYAHFWECVTGNLHRHANHDMQITCTCFVQCTFVTRNFAPECRGAVKTGLTVVMKVYKSCWIA